jgi:hypothetical protein
MVGDAGFHFIEAHRLQALGNDARCALFPVREFRMRVKVAPPFDELCFQRLRRACDLSVR